MSLVSMLEERTSTPKRKHVKKVLVKVTPDAPANWQTPPLGPSVLVDVEYPEFSDSHEIRSQGTAGGRDQWNDFSHYVRKSKPMDYVPVPYETYWFHASDTKVGWHHEGIFPQKEGCQFGSRSFGGSDKPFFGLQSLYTMNADGSFIDPPADIGRLLERSLRAVLPGMRSELSLINSIVELKDFRTFGKFVRQAGDSFERITRQMPKFYKKLTARQILQRTGESYLQWNFNLAPLYSDIQGILNSFKLYQSQLLRMMKASEKTNSRHYTVYLNELASQVDGPSYYLHGYPGPEDRETFPQFITGDYRSVRSEPSKFHVEVQFNASYSALQREHALLFALLDKLGVNFNPQIIWNAIPWSFVVDWVIDVGQFLKRYQVTNTEPVINIQRCLWSIHRVRRISTYFNYYETSAFGVPASSVYESAYRRQVFLPTLDSIKSSGLNLKEISLGAALVSSRRPRHKQIRNIKYAK